MIQFNLEVKGQQFLELLSRYQQYMPAAMRRILGAVLSSTKKDVQRKLKGQVLQKRSGKLLKAIKFKTFKDGNAAIYTKKDAYWAGFHEGGANVLPRKAKYLAFPIDGEWKRVKHVILPRRPFMEPTLHDYFDGNKWVQIGEPVFQDWLEKEQKKAGVT